MGNRDAPIKIFRFGNSTWLIIPRPKAIENTIRTVSGTMRDPKNGEATKKAPTLKDESMSNKR